MSKKYATRKLMKTRQKTAYGYNENKNTLNDDTRIWI